MGLQGLELDIRDPDVSIVSTDTFARIVRERLRAIMFINGLDLVTMSDYAGIGRQTLIRCRRGGQLLAVRTASNLAAALDISVSDIIPNNTFVSDAYGEQNVLAAYNGFVRDPVDISIMLRDYMDGSGYETENEWYRRFLSKVCPTMLSYEPPLSYYRLAILTGEDQSGLNRILNGVRKPSITKVMNVGMALGLDIDGLVGYDFMAH